MTLHDGDTDTPSSPRNSGSCSPPRLKLFLIALLPTLYGIRLIVSSQNNSWDGIIYSRQVQDTGDSSAVAVQPETKEYKEKTDIIGVDQIYLDLLRKAERRSMNDYASSHNKGKRGVVIGPVDGALRYTIMALENARRIRNVMRKDSGIKLALITSKAHVNLLNTCRQTKSQRHKSARERVCRLWANGTLFDDVVFNKEPVWTNESHFEKQGGGSRYKMISLAGSLLAPYRQSLILDSDSYACPGLEKLFAIIKPYTKQLWQLPSEAKVDLATSFEQYPWQDTDWQSAVKGDSGIHTDFQFFPDRNTGTLLYNFDREITHVFAHFVQLVSAHVINNIASPEHKVVGEQTPYKIALFLFKKLRPAFNEQMFPSHVVCRTYPQNKDAGIDGALNGMYPIQRNGEPCIDCKCTPCIINHNHNTYFVTVNGKKGWEDDVFIGEHAGNGLPRTKKRAGTSAIQKERERSVTKL